MHIEWSSPANFLPWLGFSSVDVSARRWINSTKSLHASDRRSYIMASHNQRKKRGRPSKYTSGAEKALTNATRKRQKRQQKACEEREEQHDSFYPRYALVTSPGYLWLLVIQATEEGSIFYLEGLNTFDLVTLNTLPFSRPNLEKLWQHAWEVERISRTQSDSLISPSYCARIMMFIGQCWWKHRQGTQKFRVQSLQSRPECQPWIHSRK